MKRSIMSYAKILSLVLLCLSAPTYLSAQSEEIRESKSVNISTTDEGKVKLKVVMKKGEDETTFEKTYDSHEEMHADPDLEKYGIDLGMGFGGSGFSFNGQSPQFFLHNGPGGGFWDDEDFDFQELRERMKEMMKGFGSGGFSFDDDSFMDIDSLMSKFHFRHDNGRFFLNGEEIMDIDSLREAMKDQFGNMHFDFDFDGWDNGSFNSWQDEDGDVRVITRAKVYIRNAREEDKELVGTEDAELLQLNDISFYPNPSDGRFDLAIDAINNDPIQLVIVDDQGSEVYNYTASPKKGLFVRKIDLSKEGKGLYVLKVEQNGKVLTKRILVE